LYGNRQKKDIIIKNIPKAWRKLHIEGDELLIELLSETTEKICGYRPEDSQVSEFLYSVVNKEYIEIKHSKFRKKNIIESKKVEMSKNIIQKDGLYSLNDNFTYKKVSGFVFLNDNIYVTSWKQLLLSFVKIINSIHNKEFDKITNVSGKKKTLFYEKY
jgi:hypothetical protein